MLQQPSKEEITKFCLEVQKQRPDITKEEMTSLLAVYLKENRTTSKQEKIVRKGNVCLACGVDNEPLVAFCTACGKKIGEKDILPENNKVEHELQQEKVQGEFNKPEQASRVEQNHCKSCGAEIDNNAAFCVACGKPTSESDVKKKKYHFVGTICSHCERSIEIRQPVTVCPKCGEPHHTECWEANNYTCAIPDCGGREIVEQPSIVKPVTPNIQEKSSNQDENDINAKQAENTSGTRGKSETTSGFQIQSFIRKIKENKRNNILFRLAIVVFIILPIWFLLKGTQDLGITPNEFRTRYNNVVSEDRLEIPKISTEKMGKYTTFSYGNSKNKIDGIVNKDGKIQILAVSGKINKNDGDVIDIMLASVLACNPELSKDNARQLLVKIFKAEKDQRSKETIVNNVKYHVTLPEKGVVYLWASHKDENIANAIKELSKN